MKLSLEKQKAKPVMLRVPERGNFICKDSKVGINPLYLGSRKNTGVSGEQSAKGRVL